jgi:hypothetical protein
VKRRSFLQLMGLAPISATLAASATSATPESSSPVETARRGPELTTPLEDWRPLDGCTVIDGHKISTGTIRASRLTTGRVG